jgi:hypothetical protein
MHRATSFSWSPGDGRPLPKEIAMIDSAKPLSRRDHQAVNALFEEMMPRIRLMALRAFQDRNRELRDELAAEVVARAYAAFLRLAQQGRAKIGYATPLALYSIRQVKSGRRFGTGLNIKDVTSPHAQLNKGITVRQLDHYDEENAACREVVVEDKRNGPAEIAATRIDFAAWLRTLTQRQRDIAMTLSTGETTGGAARKFDVSPSRISMLRRRFKEEWEAFVAEPDKACAAVG